MSSYIKTNLNRRPEEMTVDRIERLFSDIKKAYEFILNSGKQDLTARLGDSFGQLLVLYGPMRRARDKYNSKQGKEISGKDSVPATAPTTTLNEIDIHGDPSHGKIFSKVENLIARIGSFKAQVNADVELTSEEKKGALQWLQKKFEEVQAQSSGFESVPDPEKTSASDKFINNLSKVESHLQQFYTNWIA